VTEAPVTTELNKILVFRKRTTVTIEKTKERVYWCGIDMIGGIGMRITKITTTTNPLDRNHDRRAHSKTDVSGKRGEDQESGRLNIGKRGGA